MAEIDLGNVMGPQGEDGSQWYWGTAITGTSTSGAVFSSSGIANARVNDKYYNTSTSNIYTCTTAGAASVARWAYIGNIKGEQGNIGPAGPTGSVDFTTPITFSVAGTRADLASGDSIATLFGKTQKWFADINSGGASTLLATNLSANRALVSNASGKVAVSSVTSTELGYLDGVTSAIQTQFSTVNNNIGTLSSLETSAKGSIVAAVNELNGKITASGGVVKIGGVVILQRGVTPVTLSTSEQDFVINFHEDFLDWPSVVFSVQRSGYASQTHAVLKSRGVQGFTITAASGANSNLAVTISWIAMYTPD